MMEMVQRSIGVQVNLCNCHCLLGQTISSLPPRSPRTTTRSRHHFIFNKALSVDNSHPSEIPATGHTNFYRGPVSGDFSSSGCPCPYSHPYAYPHGSGQTVSSVTNSTSSRTARSSLSEMDSVSEADENNKLLECSPASTSSTMEQEDCCSDNNMGGDPDKSSEVSRLLPSTNSACGSNLNLAENNQSQTGSKTDLSLHQSAADILNKRDAHAQHFKRKYNFRSDSVFSDVMPLPAGSADSLSRETPKPSDNREKSGSLSSLKGQQSSNSSKWASLRKKLGRLNASSSEKNQHKSSLEHHAHLQHQHQLQQQQHDHKQHHHKPAKVSLEEKRSLLQRAKTLAILPVNRAGKDEIVKKPKEAPKHQAPPELFNVGGEMNMIPLELLIDINDLNIGQ